MGPGYFPRVLAGLLIFFGALALIRGLRKAGPPIGSIARKSAAIILASMAAFGFLLECAGLLVALVVLILGSDWACLCRSSAPGWATKRSHGKAMDIFANLLLGLQTAASFTNLFYCLVGVVLGTAIGVLPGLGPVATIAMLLPITFGLQPVTALIMLTGIFYGAQYGGSTTAILVNLPSETSSVVTCIDGYQIARQGRAGKALGTAALSSFFAGTVVTMLIALFWPPLAGIALKFGPPSISH